LTNREILLDSYAKRHWLSARLMQINEDTAHPVILPSPSEVFPPTLVVASGKGIGTEYPLTHFPLRIGREVNADIHLDSPTVSKNHARIINAMGDIVLSDMGSRNGIFVNNIRVREWLLRDGDSVRIGETIFLYCTQRGTASKNLPSKNS